jgi:uncharacterized protein YneF (UPF0154 family)
VIKTIALTLLPFAVTLAFFYLIGSFISVSFNPAEWTMECRILTTAIGFIFGFMVTYKLESSNI